MKDNSMSQLKCNAKCHSVTVTSVTFVGNRGDSNRGDNYGNRGDNRESLEDVL